MFRVAITLLVAVSVLWHSVAGCCAHHQHAQPSQAASGWNGTKDAAACPCSHGHRHASTANTESEKPACPCDSCPRRHCDEGHCSFSAPPLKSAKQIIDDHGTDLVATVVAESAALVVVRQAFDARDPTAAFAPPIRLHLLHRLLLI